MASTNTNYLNRCIDDSFTTLILESISDGVFTVDEQWRITSFNRSAEEITGIPRNEAMGRPCSDVFRASMCETDCALRRTMQTDCAVVNRSAYIINAGGTRIPISVSTAILRDANGKVIGGVETFRDLSVVEALRNELKGRFQMGDMVSCSPAMRQIFEMLPQVANSASTVLIQGETGTGKELLAKAIHSISSRKEQPFVAVNAGALPDTLLESELFGYQAGAFTGAVKNKPGRFALAHGGTLFLDEIGDISQALQVRLLRVLQTRSFEPLGATKTQRVDVRVIAASNIDLATMMEQGAFRKDLYYRINVIKLQVPPLRERKEDIPLLVEYFINRLNRLQDKAITGVSPVVMDLLMAHDYPGNIRELENIIEHAFVLCSKDDIQPSHMPGSLAAQAPKASSQDPDHMKTVVRTVEAQTILAALRHNRYNRVATARELGIHKSTLFRKIKNLGLTLPK